MNEYEEEKDILLSFMPEQILGTEIREVISQLQSSLDDIKKRVELLENTVKSTDPQCKCLGKFFRVFQFS